MINKSSRSKKWYHFFPETLHNELKHTGYGIKPIGNAAASLVSMGMWRPFRYGYNPNDKYLPDEMQKLRSGLLTVGETALGFAVPGATVGAAGKLSKGIGAINNMGRARPIISNIAGGTQKGFNAVGKGINATNAWINSPILKAGHPLQTAGNVIAKGIPRLYTAPMYYYSKLRQAPTVGNMFTRNYANTVGKYIKNNPGTVATLGALELLGVGNLSGSSAVYDTIENDRKISAGELTPEQMHALDIDADVLHHLRGWSADNNKPWYLHPAVQEAGYTESDIHSI